MTASAPTYAHNRRRQRDCCRYQLHLHPMKTSPVLRVSLATLGVSAIALALVYLWDLLSLRLQHQPSWCIDHYGTPTRFGYLLPGPSERLGTGITDFWGWLPPGVSCSFTDVVTKESETVAPAADRSYFVVILVALILVSSVGVLLGRRKP